MHKTACLLWCAVLGAAACDHRRVAVGDGASDAAVDDARRPGLDARRPGPDGPSSGSGADPLPNNCYCPAGEVWRFGACVPTVELGCGPGCDPARPGSCPAGWVCDPWAASPCCVCSAVVPACALDATGPTKPMQGPLRISPTSGMAGEPIELLVEGAPFYVGALSYEIRLADRRATDQLYGQACAFTARFDHRGLAPGIYPVEVSQYGGGEPWVLAGFYTASAGALDPPAIQPGYSCAGSAGPDEPRCAAAQPYRCGCVGGRCQCDR